jgi:hypothetical protein
VTTRDDGPAEKSAFMAASRDRVSRMLKELKRFQ